MKFIYMSLVGASDATRASIPLHMAANGSLEVGHEVAVILAGDGVELMLGDTAQKLEGIGVPPVRDLVAKLVDNAVPIYV